MKTTKYNYLIAILLLLLNGSAIGMNIASTVLKTGFRGTCSAIEFALLSMPFVSNVLFNPADIRAKKLQNVQSNTSDSINSFISTIAREQGINDIKVIARNDVHDYSTDDNGKIIYIPCKDAVELEALIKNNNRNEKEEKQLAYHIGTIYHELTHNSNESLKYIPMYESAIGTVGAVAGSIALTHAVKKYIPTISSHYLLHNAFKIARGSAALSLSLYIMQMNLYKKYDELKADDGIPSQKALLEAQAEKFEVRHAEYSKVIDIIKERAHYGDIISPPAENEFSRKQLLAMKMLPKAWFNKPLIMDCVFHAKEEHPSDIRRALRFRNRIDQLEAIDKN